VGGDAGSAPRRPHARPPPSPDRRDPLTAYLELQGLHRAFGGVVALNGIDVSLQKGEFLSLLGPSGCGKTTALRLVAGFDRPDAGSIVVDGKDLTNVAPNHRDMGMVFQAYSLFPNMTAAQNVEFGLRIRGRKRGDRRGRVEELLELVGLGHAGNRYPHQLSGGMQQRVALARALAIEPRVLLLDEPLSALDAKVRVQLREEIRRIQLELGITTLYVTHDQEEALSVSDHVAVMWGGRIEQMGTPIEMYGSPATPFVAEFIGTMNRLEGTVVEPGRGEIEHGGVRLTVEAARGLPRGERVLVLVRPEALHLEPAAEGSVGANTLAGEVLTHTFLGPVTRIKVVGAGAELIADVPTSRVAYLPIGLSVHAHVPAEGARLLSLTEPASAEPAPAGR
jgi:putative spermidine/putrescine transport system ATP-binding protein